MNVQEGVAGDFEPRFILAWQHPKAKANNGDMNKKHDFFFFFLSINFDGVSVGKKSFLSKPMQNPSLSLLLPSEQF